MGRRHRTPWATDQQLIEVLELEREALAQQIEALRASRDEDADRNRDLVLVCRYIVLGSAKRVADWANEKQWRLPGAPGNGPRKYMPLDISRILEHRSGELPSAIYDLARDVLAISGSVPS